MDAAQDLWRVLTCNVTNKGLSDRPQSDRNLFDILGALGPGADASKNEAARTEQAAIQDKATSVTADHPDVTSPRTLTEAESREVVELEERITQLEARINAGPSAKASPGTAADAETTGASCPEIDEMFKFEKGPERDTQGSKSQCCSGFTLWGGPTMPSSDQNLWTWMENFFGGVTTAHGINQVFKEYNGILRRIFWLCAFGGSFYLLYFFIGDAIMSFIDAETATALSSDSHNGLLPMVTLCNLSPIRCGCAAFYDAAVLADDNLVKLVLPYACPQLIAFKSDSWEPLDAQGNVVKWNILEEAIDFVDMTETKSRMAAFAPSAMHCDNGAHTAAAMVAKIKANNVTYHDLYTYAGYADRTRFVRSCMAVDSDRASPTAGQKVPCMEDTWWGPVTEDPDYGACQTFNPCHGFPVGDVCDTHADCQHYADPTLPGGNCTGGVCACSLCLAGAGCRLATQLNPGRGRGMRIVADVGSDQVPSLFAAAHARWANGLLVHVHTRHDVGNLAQGFSVPPGTSTDVAVERADYFDDQYPFTNCSVWAGVDASVCQANCLRRLQASACCGLDVPPIVGGRQKQVSSFDPVLGVVVNVTEPTMLCGALSGEVAACFAEQASLVANGLACIPGATGFTSPYYGGLWKRTNWYDTADAAGPAAVSAQERKSLQIQRQCVWSDADGTEAHYGTPCQNTSDCPSTVGGSPGACAPAHRAYCPDRCSYYEYHVGSPNTADLSKTAVQVMAAEELSHMTAYLALVPDAVQPQRWRPRCADGVEDDPTCLTGPQAEALVAANYALVNIDFLNFGVVVTEAVEGISAATLLGTVGGNLGMFVGMSVMTILEWLELIFFAAAAAPFLICRVRCGAFVRNADEPDGGDGGGAAEDEDVKRVLRNLATIAADRRAADGPPPPPQEGGEGDKPADGPAAVSPDGKDKTA